MMRIQRKITQALSPMIVLILLLLLLSQSVVASDFHADGMNVVPLPIVSLSASNAYISLNGEKQLTATVQSPASLDHIVWNSSNTDVATVDASGKVSGLSYGTATITAMLDIPIGGYVCSASCVVNVGAVPDGVFSLKNKGNGCQAKVRNNSISNGNYVVQYEYDGSNYEKWNFQRNQTTGYYTISTVVGSTVLYLSVRNNVSNSNAPIVLGNNPSAIGAQWKIIPGTDGAYKLIPKTGESTTGNPYYLKVISEGNDNNTVLYQSRQLAGDAALNEWYFSDIYGGRFYRTITAESPVCGEINCQGYAANVDVWGSSIDINKNEIFAEVDSGNLTLLEAERILLADTKESFESWLDSYGLSFVEETTYSADSNDRQLALNEWRIVLRIGVVINRVYNPEGVPIGVQYVYDYHFWYQTCDGTWANKHGGGPSEHLPDDVTPFSTDTSGWNLENILNFYSSDIYVYIVRQVED